MFARVEKAIPFLSIDGGQSVPALFLRSYQAWQEASAQNGPLPASGDAVDLMTLSIPLEGDAMRINFWGPPSLWGRMAEGEWMQQKPGAIPTYRSSLITGKVSLPDDLIRGKMVFIGNGSQFAQDQFVTPYFGVVTGFQLMRGVEVHANAFLTLLHRRFIRPLTALHIVFLLFALGLGTALLVFRLRLSLQLLSLTAVVAAIWVLGVWLFAAWGWWLPAVTLTAGLLLVYGLSWTARGVAGILEKQRARMISHYRLGELLGEGGMGKVFKAIDVTSQKPVAVKILNADLWEDSENRRRFANEGRILADLNHPAIVKVYETGESDAGAFIAMEYLPGGTLKKYLSEHHPLDLPGLLRLIKQIAEGLREIHRRDIIHRDIKTTNIMLDAGGDLRIMDFGLSRSPLVSMVTAQGTVLGTLGYAAPEQITGLNVDHRADIFSLGVVMYEMISGRLPFEGENEMAVIHALFNSSPPPLAGQRPDLPESLIQLIDRCMARSAAERYQTVDEILQDLQKVQISTAAENSSAPSSRRQG